MPWPSRGGWRTLLSFDVQSRFVRPNLAFAQLGLNQATDDLDCFGVRHTPSGQRPPKGKVRQRREHRDDSIVDVVSGEGRSDEGLVALLLDLNGLAHGRNEIGLPAGGMEPAGAPRVALAGSP